MASTEQLPAYVRIPSPEREPPSYEHTAFSIGTRTVSRPLVSSEQLKSHLRLLGMFALMKRKVQDPSLDPQLSEAIPALAKELSPEERWVWFLELAVERFERWVASLNASEGLFMLPPIDVWIIWHAYMLNPVWYAEDCERLPLLQALRNLKDHPIDLVASIGDDPFKFRPPQQEEVWDARTELPYNPFVSCGVHTSTDLSCPQCEKLVTVPFLNAEKTGFAQAEFSVRCESCQSWVTREKLGVAKFTRDAVLDPDDSNDLNVHGKAVYLPGTLLMSSGLTNTIVAKETKAKLKRVDVFRNDKDCRIWKNPQPYPDAETWRKAMGEKLKYSATDLRTNLEVCLIAPRARKISGAYEDGRPFSVELVSAALRQTRFTEKIAQLGWLNPGFFDSPEDEKVLQHCVVRYYGFLTLIRENGSFSVPTLDIDLAWHTHQLAPNAYKKDCSLYVGKLVNHDDKVEECLLSDGFDLTCRAWETRFGIPYMHCGCPLPGTTIGQRLSKLTVFVLSRHQPMDPPIDREDCYSATHPSDHNSVFISSAVGKQRRDVRKRKWKRRRDRDGQKIEKSKGKVNDKNLQERHTRGQDHDAAFMVPVPLTYGYGYPWVYPAYPGMCAGGVAGCGGGNSSFGCAANGLSCSGGCGGGGGGGCGGGCGGCGG